MVVFDEEQQRQAQRGGDIQGSPKAVGGDAAISAQSDGDGVSPFCFAQDALAVGDSRRPAGGGGILSANIARSGQDGQPATPRQVEDHAHIAALAGAASPGHVSRQGFGGGQPPGEQEWARTGKDRRGGSRAVARRGG